jgi:hypothetical protein
MSIGLGDVTTRANDLIAAGEYAAAQDLLAAALTEADPTPSRATPESAQAAALLAKIHVTLGDPHSARGWSTYAYAATTHLYGTHDARTTDAAITLAAVLHRVGNQDKAARLYSDAILELSAIEGPESPRVLAAHADLATVEYARGDCAAARTRLEDAWELQREVYGEGQPAGIRMLAKLGAMERDCGRSAASHEHFALAQELCRTHLPDGHPLVNQVAALARAAPDPDHTCAVEDSERLGGEGGAPTPRTPYANGASAGAHASWVPHQPDSDLLDAYAAERFLAGDDAPPSPAPLADPEPDGADAPATTDPAWPTPDDDPAWADADADGDADADERMAAGEPYAWETGQRIFDPSGGRLSAPAEPRRTTTAPPRPPDNLPAPYVPPPRPRRLLPVVLAGLLVVVLGAAAVIAGFGLLDDDPSAPRPSADPGSTATPPPAATTAAAPPRTTAAAPPPTTAAAPPPAAAGTPPGRVTLEDGGDSVTLRWAYPRAAPGPVVVAAGRPGQTPQAIAELPAGTTNYVVYGLSPGSNYCFVVSVVYSPRTAGRAAPVCTDRG